MIRRFPELAKAVEEHNAKLAEWERLATFSTKGS